MLGRRAFDAWKAGGRAAAREVLDGIEPERRERVRVIALAWWRYHHPATAKRRDRRFSARLQASMRTEDGDGQDTESAGD